MSTKRIGVSGYSQAVYISEDNSAAGENVGLAIIEKIESVGESL